MASGCRRSGWLSMNPLVLVAAGGLVVGMLIGQQMPRATAETPEAYVYELRTYTTLPGRLPNLHARFRDHTMRLFEKHGMKNVVYLTPKEGENTLAYLLAHKSVEAAKASFASFVQDPEWIAARDASELDGKIVDKIESVFYDPTDYSPLK